MKRVSPLVAALIVSSCGPAPAPIAAPAPSPSTTAVSSDDTAPAPVSVATEPDPAVVRCGVDDRPRSVTSRESEARESRNAKREMEAPAIPFGPGPSSPSVAVQVPPQPRVTIAARAPRAAAGSLAAGMVEALTAGTTAAFSDCDPLAGVEDEGVLDVRLRLASNGAPLTVSAATPSSSRFARCLLERACQLRGVSGGEGTDVVLPLLVTWNFPRAKSTTPRSAGGTAPFVTFEGIDDASTRHPFFTFVRTMSRQAARECSNGGITAAGAKARVIVRFAPRPGALTITKVDAEALAPGVAASALSCLAAAIKQEGVVPPPKTFTARELSVIVDFD